MFYQALLKKEENKKNNKKGFTLIELIIVIAILGILVAILVPTMSNYMKEAKAATGLTNARTAYSGATAAYGFLLTTQTEKNKITEEAIAAKASELLGTDIMGTDGKQVEIHVSKEGGVITGIAYVTFQSNTDPEIKGTFPQGADQGAGGETS